jgi:cytochrome P450
MKQVIAEALGGANDTEGIVSKLLMTREGRTDPYPLYRRLHELAPVYRSELGIWVLSRYKHCAAVLDDSRLDKDYERQNDSRIGPHWRDHVSLTDGARSMVNLDGPAHARLRRLVAKAFTKSAIEALRPTIMNTVNRLLEPIAEAGGGEMLQALAFPLALQVIGQMLGVPSADLDCFPRLVRDLLVVFETRPTAEQLAVADQAQLEFRSYFQDLVREKRRSPKQDLLSSLVTLEEAGDRLSEEEVWMLATLLFGAGFETTANQLGNGLLALVEHPGELARLRKDEALYRLLPDELLRFDGTAQMTVRVTKVDVEIGGQNIPAGNTLLVLLAAANRDQEQYSNADRVDVTRTNVRPLSFGGGVHHCLGAALARLEVETVFRCLLQRFRTLEVVGTPAFRDRITLRGLEGLQMICKS